MRDCCWGMYVDLFRLRLIFVTFDNKTSEKLYSLRYGNSYVVTISNANFIIFIIYLFIYYFFMVVFFWGGDVFVCLFVKLFLFLFFFMPKMHHWCIFNDLQNFECQMVSKVKDTAPISHCNLSFPFAKYTTEMSALYGFFSLLVWFDVN